MASRPRKKREHSEFSSSEEDSDSDFEDPDEIEVPGGGRNLKTIQERGAGPAAGPGVPGPSGGGARANRTFKGAGDMQPLGQSRSLLRTTNPAGGRPQPPLIDMTNDDPELEVLKMVPGKLPASGGANSFMSAAAFAGGSLGALAAGQQTSLLPGGTGLPYSDVGSGRDYMNMLQASMQKGGLSNMLSTNSTLYGPTLGLGGVGIGGMSGPMLSSLGGAAGVLPGAAASPAVMGGLQSRQISDLWRNNVHPIMRAPPGAAVEDEEVAAEDEEDMGVIETYSNYMPTKLKIGKPHPDPVVETASLASVEPPDVWYELALPDEVVDGGKLSALQLESIVYASQQHEQFLPDGNRAGFLIGDGAGVGKGRTIAGVIYENYCRGRKRAVWVSVSNDLKYDAERDLRDIGAGKIDVHFLSKMKYAKINSSINNNVSKGVIYSTYSALIGESQSGGKYKTRMKQLLHWCGEDFDGVIVFDECHKAKNLCPTGASKPTKTGQAVHELQQRLPKARIVYASATGASEPKHMAYMIRLGIWGPGSPFRSFDEFLKAVEKRGVGAMEIVAMDMKLRGTYIARQLSFQGVGFRIDEVELSSEFRRIYDKSVDLWVDLLHKFVEAAALVDADKKMKKTMWGQFWSSHQRFFKYLCIASKVRHVIQTASSVIKMGKCVVIGLQSTGEARTLETLEREEELTDFVSTAKGVIQSLVEKHFPAPDRNKVNRLLGIGPQKSLLDELGIKTDGKKEVNGSSSSLPEKRAGKKPKYQMGDEDHDSGSDFQLSDDDDEESDDEFEPVEDEDEEDEGEFNPFGADSDEDDPWARKRKKKAGRPKKNAKKAKLAKKEDPFKSLFQGKLKANGSASNSGTSTPKAEPVSCPPSAAPPQSSVDRACQMKEEMLRRIDRLGSELPANTLDQLIDELGGPENVSEMTGRKGRVVQDERGDVRYESRSAQDVPLETLNLAEKDRFMSGQKDVAIISEAASSGISLQADRRVRNQKRRVHMTLELPWSADRAIQQFGRTHRSNQVSAPEYILLISDLAGEHRFASIVAKRLESLGALTHGDRRATESRDLSRFNIDNKYGRAALEAVFQAIMGYEAPIVPPPSSYQGDFFKDVADGLVGVGLITQSEDNPGSIVLDKGHNDMSKFLNRILGLKVELQNQLFRYFSDTLAAIISNAKRTGTYDQGILDVGLTEEDTVELVKTHTFTRKHATGEAKIELHVLQVERGQSWQSAQDKWEDLVGADEGFYLSHQVRNGKKTAILAVAVEKKKTMGGARTKADKTFVIYRPNTGQQVKQETLSELKKKYRKVSKDEAEPHWNAQYHASAKTCSHAYWRGKCKNATMGHLCEIGLRKKTYNVLAGSVLSVWTQVEQVLTYDGNRRGANSRMQVVRLKLTNDRRIVGTLIPNSALRSLIQTLSDGAAESEETIY